MSNRVELDNQEMDQVAGGVLRWSKDGTVYPMDDPSAKYSYTDYYECAAWLVKNWNSIQNEEALIAMEKAGLVKKI